MQDSFSWKLPDHSFLTRATTCRWHRTRRTPHSWERSSSLGDNGHIHKLLHTSCWWHVVPNHAYIQQSPDHTHSDSSVFDSISCCSPVWLSTLSLLIWFPLLWTLIDLMNVTINFLIWDHKGFSIVTLSFPYPCRFKTVKFQVPINMNRVLMLATWWAFHSVNALQFIKFKLTIFPLLKWHSEDCGINSCNLEGRPKCSDY